MDNLTEDQTENREQSGFRDLSHLKTAKQGFMIAEEITRKNSPLFYFLSKFLSTEECCAVFTIFALWRIYSQPAHRNTEPIAEKNLLKFNQAIEDIYNGSPLDHHIHEALRAVVVQFKIPRTVFDDLTEAIEIDIHNLDFKTFADLHHYASKKAGALALSMLKIFDVKDARAESYAVNFAIGILFVEMNRNLKEAKEYIENGAEGIKFLDSLFVRTAVCILKEFYLDTLQNNKTISASILEFNNSKWQFVKKVFFNWKNFRTITRI